MVTLVVTNDLNSPVTVNGTTVQPNTNKTASISVTTPSFTVVLNNLQTPTYTVPLVCTAPFPTDPGNACTHLNPPDSVWNFQIPIILGSSTNGYIIGSVNADMQYVLYIGYCTVQLVVDSGLPSTVTLEVQANSTTLIAGGNPVQLKSVQIAKITLTAGYNATAKSLNAALNASQFPQFPEVFQNGLQGGLPIVTDVKYVTTGYGEKTMLSVTCSMTPNKPTAMVINVSLPANYSDLGFVNESFFYPTYLEGTPQNPNGFYNGVADVSGITTQPPAAKSVQKMTLIPAAPFFLIYQSKYFLQYTGNSTPIFNALPLVNGKVPNNQLDKSLFAFQQCPGKSTYQLVALTQSTYLGYVPVVPPSVLRHNLDMPTYCSNYSYEFGIFQVWNQTAYNFDCAIGYRQTGTTKVSFLSITISASNVVSVSFTDAFDVTVFTSSVIGFVVQIPLPNFIFFSLMLAPSLDFPGGITYRNSQCWAGSPVLGSTLAGAVACQNFTSTAAKKAFVANICNGEYYGAENCNPIAGPAPEKCTGWTSKMFNDVCAIACSPDSDDSIAMFCDQAKVAYCNSNDERANSADCACINVYTSSFQVPLRTSSSFPDGASYKQFVQSLSQTYGLTGNTDLAPQCWWDACNSGLSPAIILSTNQLQCPTSENACFNALSNLSVSSHSSVRVTLVNDCRVSSTPGTLKTPCSSLSGVLNNLKATALPTDYSSTPTNNLGIEDEMQAADYVVIGALLFVAVICFIVCALIVTKKVVNSQAFGTTDGKAFRIFFKD